jgi:HPt (histidine-containing phosphotransfer) domain-containing protein
MTVVGEKKRVRVRFYRMRNRLKDKIGGGAGGAGFSKEAMEKAENEFKKMAEDYPDWVGKFITQLQQELTAAKGRAADMRTPNFVRINQLAHELKGQGGTFGYPLISIFGKSLFELTAGRDGSISDEHLDLAKAHMDAMQAVIKGRVAGDGGAIGAELVKSLNAAIAKYQDKTQGKTSIKALDKSAT